MDLDSVIELVRAEDNLPGVMPEDVFGFLLLKTQGLSTIDAYTVVSRIAVDATKNSLIEKLEALKADQESRTVRGSDPCESPERRNGHNFLTGVDFVEVPVLLIDGPCDYQEYHVDESKDEFIVTAGEDGEVERHKYAWELDESGERVYQNDLRNPGKGIFIMRWVEWLG